ncbi:cardiolipin synthase [Albibacterium bauzanense]|uniref:Cardiolipin synthase n=1 Tax=Albibacterium bauzanense TaxID=653929 RepID=A0A4R1M4B2_9SPHI|nr:cardiolipin synthase [Albibacterium bauzanense]TCK85724.1 cardiolipin synthase [Albibacterium bauzanense]
MEELLKIVIDFTREWYWAPLALIYTGVIITILIENRNPTKTLAWLLVIVFLPGLGLCIYFFFGRRFKKKKVFKRKNSGEHQIFYDRWQKHRPQLEENLKKLDISLGDLANTYRFLYNENVSAPIMDNKVKLLINGEQKFPELIEAIKHAKHHIHFEYYIFEVDELGRQVIDLLIEKALEGVEVRFLVDDFGSSRMKREEALMQEAGVYFIRFLPVRFTSMADSNFRNHRKVAIIDGSTAFIGGINISGRYVNDGKNPLYWRDTSVKIQGRSVFLLQFQFWLTWHFSDGIPYELTEHYMDLDDGSDGDATVSFALSDPGSPSPYNMEAILIAIARASESVQICTPYFIPSEQISTALQVAAASGIKVELIMPMRPDSYIVRHASFSFLKPMLKRGVHVYLYKKGFMHAKTICVDGKLAFVGTVNMDIRSFYINFEIAALIYDKKLCVEMQKQFEIDKKDSKHIDMKYWKKRSVLKRGLDSVCRLLAPLL